MSIALRNIPEEMRATVVKRRLQGVSGGNGYNGARDAARHMGIALPSSGGKNRPKKVKHRKEPQSGIDLLMAVIDEQVTEVGIV